MFPKKAEFYKVSSAQKRMYFSSKVSGESSTLYNISGGVILDGELNINKLEAAFNTLINRHESLRTYFEVIDGNVVQKIVDNINFKLPVIENKKFDEIDNLFKVFVKPFDLSVAPLLRANLISFGNNKYALLVDMHHIISDGTSLNILTSELCKIYNEEALPLLNITYKDFAAFENERFTLGTFTEAENYWIHKFSGEIPVLNLPTKAPRPAVQSFDGKKLYFSINQETMDNIEKTANLLSVTPYMIMLACYYILLYKYTSGEDIIVGTPVVGRDVSDTYNLIGMFVNTLALREQIDSKLSFKEFIFKLKENLLNSYKYQTYPFDELVNKLGIKKDTSRNPLFDTMFIYQNNGFKDLNFNKIKSKYYIPDTGISKFDLSLEVVPNNKGANLSFEYATKLFDEEFIKQMSVHYLNILNAVLENEAIKTADIDMLSSEEKNKILYEFNNTKQDYPKDKTIVELFEEQVEKTPERTAIVFEDKALSYKELNEKANSLARFLRNNGVGRNDFVGIMVNRSLEMIISILAVLKAGGAYIPIDPTYPSQRIEYMLENSQAKLLLTQKKLENKITFDNKILVDLKNKAIYLLDNTNLQNINKPEDLSYVIFTSGSTGHPKGVMLKHKALSNLTAYCNSYIEYLKEPIYQAVVSITTVSFDIFIFETLISLQKGLKLIIANENEQTIPNLLSDLILKHDVKIMQSTPSRMQLILSNMDDLSGIKNLKYITLAGEQLPLSLVNTLYDIAPITVYNGYGPSETTVFSTLTKMNNQFITIGKPLSNTQIYILDKDLNPVPIGVPGELYISGDGVGKGYLGNENLTNKTFINNPFVTNTIMYKTGDFGMYNKNGEIICLGRIDNQIKIRGLRIEIGEIESLMLEYPHIKKVSVIKQIINNREIISAYFTADKRISISEFRKYLAVSLPKYMIPSYFTVLDEFPYTPNGKIDKKSLPLPKDILSSSNEKYVAPKTKLQKELALIWEKVLNTKPIGINDNFFELGGDSILAMNLNIELLKITNKVNYADIFRFPTIAELEEKINSSEDKPLFSKIENLSDNFVDILKNNTKKAKINTITYNNILLTGATGFLGMHIIDQFLKQKNVNIYCIIREEAGLTSRAKLHQKLNYYFGNKYDDLIDTRIFAITGDTTEPGFGLKHEELLTIANTVDVVINSAARVGHFGKYSDFYKANVQSVKNIIDFCKSFNKRLYHISTTSVAWRKLDSSYPSFNKKDVIFDESCLYIGQVLDNVYTHSKFEAESYILNAVSTGLDAYIFRMGNLMPRVKDGLFQENAIQNAFINKLCEFMKIGIVPDYLLDFKLEFTPVDKAAKAIYKIMRHPTKTNRIFHIYNHNYTNVEKCIKCLQKFDYKISVLPEEEFKIRINIMLNDENSKNLLKNLINDFDRDLHLDYKTDIIIRSDFTIKYLRKIHFRWNRLSHKYLMNFIDLLRKVI